MIKEVSLDSCQVSNIQLVRLISRLGRAGSGRAMDSASSVVARLLSIALIFMKRTNSKQAN